MNAFKPKSVITYLRRHPVILFVLVHTVLFLAISAGLDNIVGDNTYQYDFATQILSGRWPYLDLASEYPPLALISFLPPAFISSQITMYGFLFAVQLFLYDVVILWVLGKLSRHLKLNIWYVLGAYTLCLISLGVMVTGRFDLLPAMLSMVAIYSFIRGKNITAWAFLALGVSVKIYPVAIVPLFALYLLRQGQIRRLVSGVAVFGIVVLVINLPFYLISPRGFMDFVSYQTERGLHAESVYGSVLLLGKITSLIKVNASLTFGSWNLISPLADTLAKLSFLVTGLSLTLAYWSYSRILWKKILPVPDNKVLDEEGTLLMLRFSLLVILIMLITSKVLSPQYLIWFYPLVPLVFMRRLKTAWWLVLIAGVLSQYIYPYHYLPFEAVVPYLVILLFVRNLILTGLMVALFFQPRIESFEEPRCLPTFKQLS